MLAEELKRLDRQEPGWDREARLAGARSALEAGTARETVAAVYGEDMVREAETLAAPIQMIGFFIARFAFGCATVGQEHMPAMPKVFIIHGLTGSPNGGWRPWLMAELAKLDVYACALSMPEPGAPRLAEWVEEIARHVGRNANHPLYLVGHSLGVPAILRYLESAPEPAEISGAVLVSGPCTTHGNPKTEEFLAKPFDFASIRRRAKRFAVIHGADDGVVPFSDAEIISNELGAGLVSIPGGGHLTGSEGWRTLPQCLDALEEMMG